MADNMSDEDAAQFLVNPVTGARPLHLRGTRPSEAIAGQQRALVSVASLFRVVLGALDDAPDDASTSSSSALAAG